MCTMRITALVLAAGGSTRMGGANKLLLSLRGKPVLTHVLEAVCEAPVTEVVVITGYDARPVRAVAAAHAVRLVYNPDHAAGMATSLRCGLTAAPEADGYLICLGDMPHIAPETLRRVCAAFAAQPAPSIIAPVHGGRRGHPVLFDAAFRNALCALRGDVGARAVLQALADALVPVAVDDAGIFEDLDTPAAYAHACRARPQNTTS